VLKPDVVLFGEPIPEKAARDAQDQVLRTDLVLVIGTTAEVAPAGDIPIAARRRGARVIEVNLEPTHLTGGVADVTLLGSSTEVLPRLVREVEKKAS
jgi:NAD-dependent deacetylase